MTTWVILEGEEHDWPYDLLCVRVGNTLIFIHEDGKHDICHVEMGLPTDGRWVRFD